MRNNLILYILLILIPVVVSGQNLIFTADSLNLENWNYNQRKIVRDSSGIKHIIAEEDNTIYYISGNSATFTQPVDILDGYNACIVIGPQGSVHIVFENNGVYYSRQNKSGLWSEPLKLDDTCGMPMFPVADCDADGNVHVVYNKYGFCTGKTDTTCHLIYKKISANQVIKNKIIYEYQGESAAGSLINYTIAGSLLYKEWMFVAFEHNETIYFYSSYARDVDLELEFKLEGTEPSVSVGWAGGGWTVKQPPTPDDSPVVMFRKDEQIRACWPFEVYAPDGWIDEWNYVPVSDYEFDAYCIDDIIMPIGFSFIYQTGSELFHAFCHYENQYEILNSISVFSVASSIAYKHFSPDLVDVIWYEYRFGKYNLYYQSFPKLQLADDIIDYKVQGLQLAASPNPFHSSVNLTISVPEPGNDLSVSIYSSDGRLVKEFSRSENTHDIVEFSWDGRIESGAAAKSGTYFIKVVSGNDYVVRRLILSK